MRTSIIKVTAVDLFVCLSDTVIEQICFARRFTGKTDIHCQHILS